MTLTRGAFGRFDYDRMVVLFSMMNDKVEIPCAISTDALDSLEKSGRVAPAQRAAHLAGPGRAPDSSLQTFARAFP